VVDLEYYTNLYFSNGEDAPFSLRDKTVLQLKPVLLKDYALYLGIYDVIQLQKNEVNDIRVIQMSYLQYLIEVVFPRGGKNNIYEAKLRMLIQLCLGYKYCAFMQIKDKWNIVLCDAHGTVEHFITPSEFDDIMLLILNQNDARHDNRYINPDVRQMVQEYYNIKYKDVSTPSLEKRKAFVCSKTAKTFKELGDMTVREFELVYHALVDSEIYLATKITEASYKYEVKKPTNHPLFTKEEDPYTEAFSDVSALQDKGFKGAENIGVGLLEQ
jgi:hypothetical protein